MFQTVEKLKEIRKRRLKNIEIFRLRRAKITKECKNIDLDPVAKKNVTYDKTQ